MAGQYSKITTVDFNTIQTKVAAVLGSGGTNPNTSTSDNTFGYGQTLNSAQVSSGSKISSLQWHNLRTDLLKARQHQLGTDQSSNLTAVYNTSTNTTLGVKITETIRSSYNQMADSIITDRLILPPSSQMTLTNIVADQTRTQYELWNAPVTQIITISFASASAARYFFNSGGRLELASALTSGANSKTVSWINLIAAMGTVYFGANYSSCSGTGTATSIGWYSLTTTDQTAFQKYAAAPFAANSYRLLARRNSTSTQLILTIEFRDDFVEIPGQLDDFVLGILSTNSKVYYATGSNVSLSAPTASTTALTGGVTTPPTIVSFSTSPSSVNLFQTITLNWDINYAYTASIDNGVGSVTPTFGSVTLTPKISGVATLTAVNPAGTVSSSIPITVIWPAPIISVSPNVTNVNEGNSVTFTVGTTYVYNNTTLYWTVLGSTATSADFTTAMSGSVLVTTDSSIWNGTTPNITITILADELTEPPPESFQLQIRSGSITGTVLQTSSIVTINDTSKTPAYQIVPSTTSVNEGSSVTFNITVNNLASGTPLYWTLAGTVNAADFTDALGVSNSVTISGTYDTSTASFTKTLKNDFTTEGAETITAQLRRYSSTSTVLVSTSVTVNDTSVETYAISASTTSVNEGDTVTFSVTTQGVPNNTTLYWTTTGGTNSADFTDSATSGSFVINNNAGTITRQLARDATTEGTETFAIEVRTGGTGGSVKATSSSITVNDTSKTPIVSVGVDKSSVDEGGSATFTISIQNVDVGTSVSWSVQGNVSSADFSDSSGMSGSYSYSGSNYSITKTLSLDQLTDPGESFSIKATVGAVSNTSSSVSINDTSKTPSPTVSTSRSGSMNEGDTQDFYFSVVNFPGGSLGVSWSVLGTVSAADFTDNTSSGSFTYTGGTATISRTLKNDLTTEGNETLAMRFTCTYGTVDSGYITVNDTSILPSGSVGFSSSGTWSVPADVSTVRILIFGGGGGGGWSNVGGVNNLGIQSSTDRYGGGGGGGGGKQDFYWSVWTGYTFGFTIGSGGSRGYAGSGQNPSAGGDSNVTNSGGVIAWALGGGQGYNAAYQNPTVGTGGGGGFPNGGSGTDGGQSNKPNQTYGGNGGNFWNDNGANGGYALGGWQGDNFFRDGQGDKFYGGGGGGAGVEAGATGPVRSYGAGGTGHGGWLFFRWGTNMNY